MCLITIAIPTYNRGPRLEKAVRDLVKEINSSHNKKDVSVLISDNGSEDSTSQVTSDSLKVFKNSNIPFRSIRSGKNRGFDHNVSACFKNSNSKYVWFMSDDDNIIPGSLDIIINDIKEHKPTVLFYNYDQSRSEKTPFITEFVFFRKIKSDNFFSLQRIVQFPSLSTLVVERCQSGLSLPVVNSGFFHVALALHCVLSQGGILNSPVFVAKPDPGRKNNMDFPPYIQNYINSDIKRILKMHGKMNFYEKLSVEHVDFLISSLNSLGCYYRGKITMKDSLKDEIKLMALREARSGWLERMKSWKNIVEIFKFFFSVVYGLFRYFFFYCKK